MSRMNPRGGRQICFVPPTLSLGGADQGDIKLSWDKCKLFDLKLRRALTYHKWQARPTPVPENSNFPDLEKYLSTPPRFRLSTSASIGV